MSSGPDLLVAGAGGGAVGALAAAERGKQVLLIDSSPYFLQASNTAMSTAMIPGAGSRFQDAAGLEDSPDAFVADVMAKTKGSADEALTRALAEASAPLVEWLVDHGALPLHLVTDFNYPGHAVPRCHTVDGRTGATLLRLIHERVEAEPLVDVLVPARLSGLERSGDGWVARVAYPDGSAEAIEAGAVLLATSGFGADAGLVGRHIPEIAGAVYHGSDQARGDALRLGADVGADTDFLDAYQGHGALAVGANTLAGWALVMHGGIVVNRDAERFADETQGYSEFAALELTQPDATAFIVFDERIRQLCRSFEDFLQTEAAGVVHEAADPAALAARLGIDPARLTSTFEATAATVTSGGADPLGRREWPSKPLQAPYFGVRVAPALFHTQGGLRVDGDARVLDAARAPIPGLYAAGGAAMGISGHGASGYLAGNGLLAALGLAWLAGRHVGA